MKAELERLFSREISPTKTKQRPFEKVGCLYASSTCYCTHNILPLSWSVFSFLSLKLSSCLESSLFFLYVRSSCIDDPVNLAEAKSHLPEGELLSLKFGSQFISFFEVSDWLVGVKFQRWLKVAIKRATQVCNTFAAKNALQSPWIHLDHCFSLLPSKISCVRSEVFVFRQFA